MAGLLRPVCFRSFSPLVGPAATTASPARALCWCVKGTEWSDGTEGAGEEYVNMYKRLHTLMASRLWLSAFQQGTNVTFRQYPNALEYRRDREATGSIARRKRCVQSATNSNCQVGEATNMYGWRT